MTPMQAIRSATSVAAEFLGIQERLGTLEPGKLADIIAVDDIAWADQKLLRKAFKSIKRAQATTALTYRTDL